ncbi:MFS transporter [Cronobacter turicensis]|uniref:MFS transporter n=1 Tax=Cronobacter turicensis TaxID=413502 RepID=UPI001D4E7873|nr:MFS transporter [Cronobacter turicensis]EGT4493309.1 MFS transporter [Cronobacter turicensis]EKM0438477.1 MFS transporter [Cronobacter turicensis]ELY4323375.1 MFS transporter [Cronobacter turicensis]ELY5945082.1 MFS transporter [Cronobacter turicensis]ELY5963192.1 MFS transporter [Cronobacter turicensis]
MLRSLQALCLMSFFLADVRDGLGPFLGIFLTERHWRPDDIGFVMTAGGIAALLATVPAGIMIDATRKKRLLLLVCCALVTLATLLLWHSTHYRVAMMSQIVSGLAAALIGPLVAGITLGLTGQLGFTHQMGRNEAFNHGGNMVAAVLAGCAMWLWGIGAVFILMTGMAFFTALCVLAIREQDIDHDVARGIEKGDPAHNTVPQLSVLMRNPVLITTGLTLLLFHLGNAALLPMLSMRVASTGSSLWSPGLYAAATVVISQCVMIPVALYTSAQAQRYGYRQLIMIALIVLPVRAALAASFAGPLSVIPVQILDGVAAGILGVAVPGYIVNALRGSGHINAGQSVIMLMQGAGAAFSPALAGCIVAHSSWRMAFAALGVVALAALIVWWRAGARVSATA